MTGPSQLGKTSPSDSHASTPGWVAWHLLSALGIVAVVTGARLGGPVWELEPDRRVFVIGLALTHLSSALALRWQSRGGQLGSVRRAAGTVAACYGAYAVMLLMSGWYHSRSALGISVLLSLALVTLPLMYARRMRPLPATGLGLIVFLALALSSTPSDAVPRGAGERSDATHEGDDGHTSVRVLPAMFHSLQLSESTRYARREVNGGTISALERGFLLASGHGSLHYVEELLQSDTLDVRRLPYRVPLNREAFQADWPDAEADFFRTGDVLALETGSRRTVIASHHYWLVVPRASCSTSPRPKRIEGRP